MAHADHGSFETIDGVQAARVAGEVVKSLVADKKLPDSWKNAKPSAARTVPVGGATGVRYVRRSVGGISKVGTEQACLAAITTLFADRA